LFATGTPDAVKWPATPPITNKETHIVVGEVGGVVGAMSNLSERGRVLVFCIGAVAVLVVAFVFMRDDSTAEPAAAPSQPSAPSSTASGPAAPSDSGPAASTSVSDLLPLNGATLARLTDSAEQITRILVTPSLSSLEMNEQARNVREVNQNLVEAPLSGSEFQLKDDPDAVASADPSLDAVPAVSVKKYVALSQGNFIVDVAAGDAVYTYSFERDGQWNVAWVKADSCAKTVPCPLPVGAD